jgi:hypothetical protein
MIAKNRPQNKKTQEGPIEVSSFQGVFCQNQNTTKSWDVTVRGSRWETSTCTDRREAEVPPMSPAPANMLWVFPNSTGAHSS